MILSRPSLQRLLEGENPVVLANAGNEVIVDFVSYTLHLGNEFLYYHDPDLRPFVPPEERPTETREGPVVLPPGGKVLGCTAEFVEMPNQYMGFVQTKGSLARGFLIVHLCDGQIDPGYRGCITLEIVNFSDFNYVLEPGMPIAQLFIQELSEGLNAGYDGRFQGSHGPTPMRSPKG
jgi:dCTP deaminase